MRFTKIIALLTSAALFGGIAAACADDTPSARDLSLEDAVGQLLMIGFRGVELDSETAAMFAAVKPGGVVLFDYDVASGGEEPRNIESPAQLTALTGSLQAQAELGMFIAVDAEGGFVNRLKEKYGFEVIVPSALTLGAGTDAETTAIATALAEQMVTLGINWNLAPVVDVNIFPDSPAIGRWERSFSDNPNVVSAHADAFATAHRETGIIPTLKHFPGHGSAVGDTHLGVTDVTDSFKQDLELLPYRTLIDDGYADTVMTAHIVNRELDPTATPATPSYPIMTELLRDELGFEGVIVSDDMMMGAIVEEYTLEQAVVETLQAGVDVILIAQQSAEYDFSKIPLIKQAILDAIASGELDEDRIYASVQRILDLKVRYGIIE